MNATEFCLMCDRFGEFSAEDSFLCPECYAEATGVAIATPSDDDESDGVWYDEDEDGYGYFDYGYGEA